jgi:integrase
MADFLNLQYHQPAFRHLMKIFSGDIRDLLIRRFAEFRGNQFLSRFPTNQVIEGEAAWNLASEILDSIDNEMRTLVYIRSDKELTDIADDDVARLVAWRRAHRVLRKNLNPKDCPLISPFTVNDTTEQLKKLFTRAKLLGARFPREPQWRKHWVTEPSERVNELRGDQGERLQAAARDEYAPVLAFAEATGLRQRECLLRWSEVDWDNERIVKRGKGGKMVIARITSDVRAILWPLRCNHPEFVFNYVAQRTGVDRVKGERQPITQSGLKTQWRRLCKRAGVTGFRFHDYRHDFATKLLRQTGNLKLVSRALNHADVKTTVRYAHVVDDDIRAALEERARQKSPGNSPADTKRSA